MPWHHAGTEVMSAVVNPSGALDISAVVGTQAVIVLLKVSDSSGGAGSVRTNVYVSNGGINYTEFTATRTDGIVLAWTNSSGVINDLTGVGTITAFVLGWADSDVQASPPTVFGPDTFPAWKDLDLTSEVGDASALALLGWIQTAGGTTQARSRKNTDAETPGYGANTADINSTTQDTSLIVAPLDDSAVTSISDTSSGYGSVTLDGAVRDIDGWVNSDAVVYSGAYPPGSWTELDISAVTGVQRSLVCLRIDLDTTAAVINYWAVRPNKDTGAYLPAATADGFGCNTGRATLGEAVYLVTETDDLGKVDWINDSPDQNVTVTVLGYVGADVSIPVLSQQTPIDTTTAMTQIGCTITDVYGLDTSSLGFAITFADGQQFIMIAGGVIQSGWAGSVVELNDGGNGPRELMITLNSWPDDLPNGQLVTFLVAIENAFGGVL